MKATYFFNMGVGLTKGRVKKNWNFPDLVRPTHPCNHRNLEKKFLVILCMVDTMGGAYSQQSVRCGQHDAWCGRRDACEVWWVGQNQCHTPPYMAKNKFF